MIPADETRKSSAPIFYHGHLTEKCKFLKFSLEDLLKKGHIQEFMKEPTTQKRGDEQPNVAT